MATIMIAKDFDVEALSRVVEEAVEEATGIFAEILNDGSLDTLKDGYTECVIDDVKLTIENAEEDGEELTLDKLIENITYAISNNAPFSCDEIAAYLDERYWQEFIKDVTENVCKAVNKFFNAE